MAKRHLRRALLGAAFTLSAAACTIHRGEWQPAPAEPAPALASAPRLFLIGGLGGGPGAKAVSDALLRSFDQAQARGEPMIVIWLGDQLDPETCEPPADPASAQLFTKVAQHRARGGASLAVRGLTEWTCAAPEAPQIAANELVRVRRGGEVERVSRCAGAPLRCEILPDPGDSLVELVLLDTTPWLDRAAAGDGPAAEASLAEQRALIAALLAAPGPERILVTHHPIESAGPHGQGGIWPDSALLFHEPSLARAILSGAFVGAVSGHERSLQAVADASPAVKRSSREWLRAPFFQVIAGAVARPDAGRGPRTWRFFQGTALAPDHISNHAGYAELALQPSAYEVTLRARRFGRWREAALTIDRGRPPHPAETASPVMDPCADCDPIAARW